MRQRACPACIVLLVLQYQSWPLVLASTYCLAGLPSCCQSCWLFVQAFVPSKAQDSTCCVMRPHSVQQCPCPCLCLGSVGVRTKVSTCRDPLHTIIHSHPGAQPGDPSILRGSRHQPTAPVLKMGHAVAGGVALGVHHVLWGAGTAQQRAPQSICQGEQHGASERGCQASCGTWGLCMAALALSAGIVPGDGDQWSAHACTTGSRYGPACHLPTAFLGTASPPSGGSL